MRRRPSRLGGRALSFVLAPSKARTILSSTACSQDETPLMLLCSGSFSAPEMKVRAGQLTARAQEMGEAPLQFDLWAG